MGIPLPVDRRGFTLIELLVVIFIILIVSVVALQAILPALSHREVSEAARIVHAALVGARDKAIRTQQPSGIRLLPDPALTPVTATGLIDPTQILACNRIVPIDPAPEYSEGYLDVAKSAVAPPSSVWTSLPPIAYPGTNGAFTYPGVGALMVMETTYVPGTWPAQPNPPTNWMWNIRVGDRIQISNAGPWYTVVGPMAITPAGNTFNGVFYTNPERFVNVGPPGSPLPLQSQYSTQGHTLNYTREFLFLVNSQDDNGNGWVDEGWDGVDNNGNVSVDEPIEWEAEQWAGALQTQSFVAGLPLLANSAYNIRRRPTLSSNSREVALPTGVVIDLTGWALPIPERSRIPIGMFNPDTGYVDIMINPDGTVLPTTKYSSPSSFNIAGSFIHLWLAQRSDLAAPSATASTITPTGNPFLPLPQGLAPAMFGGQELKGEFALVTLFARTGQIVTGRNMPFLFNSNAGGFTNSPGGTPTPLQYYGPNYPYMQAQQGRQSQ